MTISTKWNLKKRSIVVTFGLIFFITAAVQSRLETHASYSKNFEIVQKKKEQNIALVSAVAESLFLTGEKDVIEGHLRDAVKIRWIDFYVLIYKGNLVSLGSIRKLSDQSLATLLQKHPPNQVLRFDSTFESESSIRRPGSTIDKNSIEDFRFMATELGRGWDLRVGINMDRTAFFDELDALVIDENIRLFVMGFLLTLVIFVFVSKDIRKAARALSMPGSHRVDGIKSLSAEADALQRGIVGFQDAYVRLQEESSRLKAQVLPSLQKELASGLTPPYEFSSTLVRTDINGFSRIFREHSTDEFLGFINEFFVECSHLISQYDGLIHEFVGDEIIFYFKDDGVTNSFTRALRCLSEINLAAEKIHLETESGPGYPFRVKSSLAHGKLRYGPLLNGYSIAGSTLIETTRILSAVTEKNENTVYFESTNLSRVHPGVRWSSAFVTQLKGFEGDREIVRYDGHLSVSEVLAKRDLVEVALPDYRSISDWKEIVFHEDLDKRLSPVSDDTQATLRSSSISSSIVSSIANMKSTRFDEQLTMDLLKAIESKMAAKSLVDSHLVATMLMALSRISAENWLFSNSKFIAVVLAAFQSSSSRVVANALELCFEIRARSKQSLGRSIERRAEEFLQSADSRVRANAALFLSLGGLRHELVMALESMLRSNDSKAVQSSAYVVAKIENHFKDFDPVYLKTQVEFEALSKFAREKSSAHGDKGAA